MTKAPNNTPATPPALPTAEQVLALAPDAAAQTNARLAAVASKWQALERSPRALWGLFHGSAGDPYRTQVDLTDLASRCSCPSRKLPCKHSLALMMLAAERPGVFQQRSVPDWVAEWIDARDSRREKTVTAKPNGKTTVSTAKADTAAAAAQKRAASRSRKVDAGVAELITWLGDLFRQGIAALPGKPLSFWEQPAAHMWDAQARGLARRLRRMASIPYSGEGWQERMIEQAGLLALLLEGYARLDDLTPEIQADIRTQVGFTQNQDELLALPGLVDHWAILGQAQEAEEQLTVQRTWLWSAHSRRSALVLDYAVRGAPLDASLQPGRVIPAELVYFPGNFPLRALVKRRTGSLTRMDAFPGYPDFKAALAGANHALARNPWLETLPLPLKAVTPLRDPNGGWSLVDSAGCLLPLSPRFERGWHLLAISGGAALDVFGEWDGYTLLPLSAWNGSGLISLALPLPEERPEARRRG